MFWGLIMEPKRRYSQVVEKPFHISMAAIDTEGADNKQSQIMCTYKGKNYLLCTLQKSSVLQCPIDIFFEKGMEVSFATNGNCNVHLTGYLVKESQKPLMGSDDLKTVEEEESEDEDVEEEEADEEGEEDAEDEEDEEEDEDEEEETEAEEMMEVNLKKKKKQGIESGPPRKKVKTVDLEETVSAQDSDEESEESTSSEESDEVFSGNISNSKLNGRSNKSPTKNKDNKPKRKVVNVDGVKIEEVKIGTGKIAKMGSLVKVQYDTKLGNGSNIGEPLRVRTLRVGAPKITKGLSIGIKDMKEGGMRVVTIPPKQAIPSMPGSKLPPKTELCCNVQLMEVIR